MSNYIVLASARSKPVEQGQRQDSWARYHRLRASSWQGDVSIGRLQVGKAFPERPCVDALPSRRRAAQTGQMPSAICEAQCLQTVTRCGRNPGPGTAHHVPDRECIVRTARRDGRRIWRIQKQESRFSIWAAAYRPLNLVMRNLKSQHVVIISQRQRAPWWSGGGKQSFAWLPHP